MNDNDLVETPCPVCKQKFKTVEARLLHDIFGNCLDSGTSRQRLLADAVVKIAVAAGITDGLTPMTGPEVLFLAEAAVEQVESMAVAEAGAKARRDLADAIKDVCWRATPYGETEDGDTFAYIVTKGAMHRLIGAAQCNGISAAFRDRAALTPAATQQQATPGQPTRSIEEYRQ